ncbi:NAD(P)H-dependent oxidoreductase [Eggerthella timonensis]|uniref:NAD(P)H-dependent oxidoreductase n=1 Tax=Eggerthella timonensis TaxID=1871008 RepID=UPI000C78FC92|nr:NAD(P)H-dependent oxidoreductase [Eggerthella timonensis]
MKKIFAFCGSRQRNSFTRAILEQISDGYCREKADIEVQIMTPNDYVLNHSEDPAEPFFLGADKNERDNLDDTRMLKRKLEQADLVIFASPTYYGAVTADMKLFIDRFCHLAHLFYFAKKPCQTLVTSDGTGHTQVSNYLKQFCDGLGLVRTCEIVQTSKQKLDLKKLDSVVKAGISAMENPDSLCPGVSMEAAFQSWKLNVLRQDQKCSERAYWTKTGLINYDRLADYFHSLG